MLENDTRKRIRGNIANTTLDGLHFLFQFEYTVYSIACITRRFITAADMLIVFQNFQIMLSFNEIGIFEYPVVE